VRQHSEVLSPALVLPRVAAHRLANQLTRVFRGTYGAKTGLQALAAALTRQLLVGGFSPDMIARAFENCVVCHPAVRDARGGATRHAETATLIAMTTASVASVVRERAERRPTRGTV
jgi:hypothetical protein